jgi:hypothetical protein
LHSLAYFILNILIVIVPNVHVFIYFYPVRLTNILVVSFMSYLADDLSCSIYMGFKFRMFFP